MKYVILFLLPPLASEQDSHMWKSQFNFSLHDPDQLLYVEHICHEVCQCFNFADPSMMLLSYVCKIVQKIL